MKQLRLITGKFVAGKQWELCAKEFYHVTKRQSYLLQSHFNTA